MGGQDELRAASLRRQELILSLRELASTEEGRQVAFNVLNPPPDGQRAFYFGCLGSPGHFFFTETGRAAHGEAERLLPWRNVDAVLCPGYEAPYDNGPEEQGAARLHQKEGWTALAFWDRSVDKRGGCNSVLFVQGLLSFEQMLHVGRTRFKRVFDRFGFQIRQAPAGYGKGTLLAPPMRTAKIVLTDVKDSDGWAVLCSELGVADAVRDSHFKYGEFGTLELEIDQSLRVVGGRVIPSGDG